jgi:formate dehydrogenase subunit gamma
MSALPLTSRLTLQNLMAVLWLAMVIAIAPLPVAAQTTSPSGSNPTASSVNEQKLLQELDRLSGRVSVPNPQLAMLNQPQGRSYQSFHERWLPWIGGIVILGMLVILLVFYLWRGRIRLRAEEQSGRVVVRFSAVERINHWMMATCFIVLAVTGLNYVFGKRLLMPVIGAEAFASWSQWAKFAHNFIAWPFMLALLVMFVVWVRDNVPDRYDAAWLRASGGLFGGRQPPADRFNAGQKFIFWSVIVGGLLLSVSGVIMLFPFALVELQGMQIAQYVHAITAVVLTAVILAHIYIGSLGMEGAIGAMTTGTVDQAWAYHHHPAWVERQRQGSVREAGLGPGEVPAS